MNLVLSLEIIWKLTSCKIIWRIYVRSFLVCHFKFMKIYYVVGEIKMVGILDRHNGKYLLIGGRLTAASH